MNPLVTLGASELRALAAAASDGRLNPATPGLVGRFVSDGAAVSRALGELAASGAALAPTLELLAEAAKRRSSVEDLVELVLTGPNTGTGRDTGVVVRQLFREGHNPTDTLNLRFLRNYIVAKNESYFSHGSGLVLVPARGTEGVTRRVAARPNKRKVSG